MRDNGTFEICYRQKSKQYFLKTSIFIIEIFLTNFN